MFNKQMHALQEAVQVLLSAPGNLLLTLRSRAVWCKDAHLEVRTPSATACMLSTMADSFSPLPIRRPTVRLRLRSPAALRHFWFDLSGKTPLHDIGPQAPVLQLVSVLPDMYHMLLTQGFPLSDTVGAYPERLT